MKTESYQLFEPSDGCSPIMPVNTVKSVFTIHKITVFDATINPDDLSDLGQPVQTTTLFPKHRARLGFSLSFLVPEFETMLRPREITAVNGKKVLAAIDGVFIPAGSRLIGNVSVVPEVKIQDMSVFATAETSISIGGKNYIIHPKTRSILETYGEAYAKSGDQRIKLVLDVDTIEVKDQQMLLVDRKVPIHDRLRKVSFNSDSLTRFQTTGSMLARVGNKSVRLVVPSDGNNQMVYSTARKDELIVAKRDALMEAALEAAKEKIRSRTRVRKGILPTFEVGLLSSYEQEWQLLGYSRGSLISSITLAPKEELTIELFSWDRSKLETTKEFSTEYERNREMNNMLRTTSNIVNELSESMDMDASLDADATMPKEVTTVADVHGAGAGSVGRQVKENLNLTLDSLNERTLRVAELYKASHQVKIVQTEESGIETRITRKLQNPNSSHTLTFNYYEILETHKVTTRLKSTKQYCLLVENNDIPLDNLDFILAFENRLQQALLSPVYRAGFEAAKTLAGQRWFEQNSRIKAELEAQLTAIESIDSPGVPLKGIFATAKNLVDILQDFIDLDMNRATDTILKHVNPWDSEEVSEGALRNAQESMGLFTYWTKLIAAYPGFDQRASNFVEKVRDLFDDPANQDEIIRQAHLLVDGMDDDWIMGLKVFLVSYVVLALASIIITPIPLIAGVMTSYFVDNDNGLTKAINKARQELKTMDMKQQAQLLQPTPPAEDANETPDIPQVYSLTELANAHAEFEKLILHLQAHRVYYQNAIWRSEDPDERFFRLGLANLTPFIENRLVGFVGKKAMYPLRLESLPSNLRDFINKELSNFTIDDNNDNPIKDKVEQISVPTAGVYMESMLGSCEALEPYLLTHRQLDIEQKQLENQLLMEKLAIAKLESRRLQARLSATPPLLDNPHNEPHQDVTA